MIDYLKEIKSLLFPLPEEFSQAGLEFKAISESEDIVGKSNEEKICKPYLV